VLEELIRYEMVAASARRAGYDRDPEIVAATKRLMVNRYQQDQLAARRSALTVSDEEIESAYAADAERFATPEMARAGVIFIDARAGISEEKRSDRIARAQAAHAAALDDFQTAAAEYSDDQATRYRAGDGGWLARDDPNARWEPAVMDAIFAQDQAEVVTPIVDGVRGYYVVQLLERRESAVRPLEQVRDVVRQRMLRERQEGAEKAFYRELRTQLPLEIDIERVHELEVPTRGPDLPIERLGDEPPSRMPSG